MEREILNKVANIAVAASLVAGGCAPMNTHAEREKQRISNEPPISEITDYEIDNYPTGTSPIPIPTLTTQPPLKESSNIEPTPTISQEIKPFNYEILNIADWGEYELEEVEKKEPGYRIEIIDETSMYLIPLRRDNFVDERREVKEILIPYGHSFEIAEVRNITGPNGEKIKLGLIANTYGANFVSSVLLEATDEKGTNIKFSKEDTIARSVSYVATEDSIYPNKVINTLNALINMSKSQDEKGPLKGGEEQSYLHMIGLKDPNKNNNYEYGLTSSGSIVRGGGVCAMATGISALVHLQGGDPYEIKEQWAHPVRYAQGPFSPSEYLVDATVDYNATETYDFRWIPPKDKYLHIEIFTIPSDLPYSKTEKDGVGGLSDALLIVSISFEDTPPENQTEKLKKELENYRAYRNSQHQKRLNGRDMDKNALNHPLDARMRDSTNLIYNVEDIREFEHTVERSRELQDILQLQEAVNTYSEESGIHLNQYLKETDWYKNHITDENKERVDRILRLGTLTRVEGQPLQCVGFVMIASWLYPEIPIAYVGGAPVGSARELVPEELRNYTYGEKRVMATNYGALAIAGEEIAIDDYQPGDLFVRVDGAPMASTGKPTGHIGLILEKMKDKQGNTILLVADSNRHNDGRIRIFVVNEGNIDEVFGPRQKYIVRTNSN